MPDPNPAPRRPAPSYWSDVVLSGALAGGVALGRRSGRLSPLTARAYVAGCLVGLTWETAFHLLGPESPWRPLRERPMYTNLTAFPLPPRCQPVVHALWDGGLFLVGLGLCRLLPGHRGVPAHRGFARFRWSDLAVMTAWGSAQELAVELACNGTLWRYHPRPWNPVLFRRGGEDYTVLPQLTWVVAPAAFHAVLLRLARREAGRTT